MINVREMSLHETDLVIRYFHDSTPEYLEILGVDPTRMPRIAEWQDRYRREYGLPIQERSTLLVLWLADDAPIGFSTTDRITFGEQANMHLHMINPDVRGRGLGSECVRLSADIYFRRLAIRRLLCEPNAFNVAPNRALQKAGFSYVKTHRTVPRLMGFHQPVTRWVLEQPDA